jgi:hypothetical protein
VARNRSQRRRRVILLSLAALVTLAALAFAQDVNRSAHQAHSNTVALNRNFAALANNVISELNAADARGAYVLSQGTTLTRPVFAARLIQINRSLSLIVYQAQLLKAPHIVANLNTTLATIATRHVVDDQTIFAQAAASIAIPWVAPSSPVAHPAQDLTATTSQWNAVSTVLASQPGRASLNALTDALGPLAQAGYTNLLRSPSLRVVRGIGVAAVQVQPSPLPAPAGELLVPSVGYLHLGVSVTNRAYVEQPVSITVRLTPTNGLGALQYRTFSLALRPLGSYAFVPNNLYVVGSERATLEVSVTGAPAAAGLSLHKTYRVVVSPSGN